MITDQILQEYLQQNQTPNLVPMNLNLIGNHGENIPAWSVKFNQLTTEEMYQELKYILNQLMLAQMNEEQRLNLMYQVGKVGQVLISKLHTSYVTETGFLNVEQQHALDRVIAIYYLSIMVYHSVWQRLASEIKTQPESSGGLGWFRRLGKAEPTTTPTDIVKRCVFSMMVLLKQALLEKQLGYRQSTHVIWHYINACYRFAQTYQWQYYSFDLNGILNYPGKMQIAEIYQQCILADIIKPANYRRHTLLNLQEGLVEWAKYMPILAQPTQKPYIFVNLEGDDGAKLLTSDIKFNPFATTSQCVFVDLHPLIDKLAQMIANPAPNPNDVGKTRLAKLVLPNLQQQLRPPLAYQDIDERCEVVVGFHAVHYILAGKASLENLIHSHLLEERFRPLPHALSMEHPTTGILLGKVAQYRKLYWQHVQTQEELSSVQRRSGGQSVIHQFRANSLVALHAHNEQGIPMWQLGKINSLKQQRLKSTVISANDYLDVSQDIPKEVILSAEMEVVMLGNGIVPCGVRIVNPDSRLPRFMPALIIPKSALLERPHTSLMMARFGYRVEDKLIIRIDSKEVTVQLTELLMMNDDIEEYAFVRLNQ